MDSAQGDRSRPWRTWLPVLIVGIACLALGVAGAVLFAQVQPVAPIKVVAPAANVPAAAEFLKDRLELYDRRARDIQWILAALLATGALFTLLQGVFAFVSVQNFNSMVEATLKKASDAAAKIDDTRAELKTEFQRRFATVEGEAKSDIEGLRKKLEAQFPIASRIEDSIKEALSVLPGYFQDPNWYEGGNWGDNLFAKLRADQRQEILFYERVIAGCATLSPPRLDEQLSYTFRGLGSFYTSRFKTVKDPDDLERAKFYFGRSIRCSSSEFVSLNMLGYIARTTEPPDYDEAERWFRKSLATRPGQQRARYNLADIAYHRDKDYQTTITHYREALQQEKWEEYRSTLDNQTYVRFNLSCTLARSWSSSNSKYEAEEALNLLEEAIRTGAKYLRDYLPQEIEPGGDLAGLRASLEYAERLAEILKLWTN
jgi:tetratricopeptide (TPR) repeat protein